MEAIPIPEITAEIVGRAFYEKWICRFGVPAKIVTDQGRQFEAELFRSIAAICGAKVAHTTSYHPQCNGKVERLHRTLKGAIKAHNNIRWTESLPTVLLGLRAAIRPDISYTIAQMVYELKALEPPYEGPYTVHKKYDKYFTILIKDKTINISVDRLKPAYLLAVDNQNEQTSVGQKNEISNWKELSPMPDEQSTTSCGRKIKKNQCVPLTATHCRLRLTWSREHALWTPQQWSCVMFSDESRFSLQFDYCQTLIWRAPGTRYHQENTIERHRYGGVGWLVWGGNILGSRTDLHVQSVRV
ncbi:retrovirus-related Pol polyprotein from transposon opus [Trichonephila clavipes]|nr:retrovirus-related Pol polyprotein from transposon opus [Trichonephila clavipes]